MLEMIDLVIEIRNLYIITLHDVRILITHERLNVCTSINFLFLVIILVITAICKLNY